MKNIRRLIFALVLCCVSQGYTYSQTMEWKENYSYTVLQDDFSNSQIDQNKWTVVDNEYEFHTAFIDSSATIGIDGGSLRLTSIMCSNCPVGTYTQIHAAAAKIVSKDKFQYGVFESRIHFPKKDGTSAFFSLRGGNGISCSQGGAYENEIDIAHIWWRLLYPYSHASYEIAHYHPGTNCVEDGLLVSIETDYYSYQVPSSYRTYKCVWTPSYVRFYNNGAMVHEVINTEDKCDECNDEWFPKYPMNLSFWQYFLTDVLLYMDAPQSTYIDYVSVKRFFATPEITLSSDAICSSGAATLNVESEATDITWSLSPTNLFSGITIGTSNSAPFSASSQNGEATITYSFKMPSGESFTAEKTFWVGTPIIDPTTISYSNGADAGNYHCSDCFGNTVAVNLPCDFDYLDVKLTNLSESQTISQFTVLGSSSGAGTIYITMAGTTPPAGQYMFWVRGQNGCGTGDWSKKAVEYIDCSSGGLLLFSPNPTSGETTVSIDLEQLDVDIITTSTSNSDLNDTEEWELEVYDNNQVLKLKKTKLKEKSTKLDTKSWKDGIYTARAKYKDEIIFGKLVVSKN